MPHGRPGVEDAEADLSAVHVGHARERAADQPVRAVPSFHHGEPSLLVAVLRGQARPRRGHAEVAVQLLDLLRDRVVQGETVVAFQRTFSLDMAYFVGVDVGTGSARAALVSETGKVLKVSVHQIQTWNPRKDFYEQSSDDIWNSCAACVREVTAQIEKSKVKGIGFDATCSLVVLDARGNPLSASPTGNNEQNVILWMDHRAELEAQKINELRHPVLRYVGGKISLEMQTPKLLWLKTHMMNECWDKAALFFDLPDFLTWKSTGCEARSLCSLVCKWTYEAGADDNAGWNESYFKAAGLEDLLKGASRKIGSRVIAPGSAVGNGLSESAAKELGLEPGIPVGASLIDAHAGGLGMIGCSAEDVDADFHSRLGLICGTSTCHMVVSHSPVFAPGVWGPYYSAMVPGMWLNEGGQSATGKLLDHIIESHPATPAIRSKLDDLHIQQYLSNLLQELARKGNFKSVAFLTRDLHVWPDFHGNRSPVADPTLRGSICGLTLSADEENLALLYLATVQALSYGTRHILETLQSAGCSAIRSVLICGGLSKNPLFVQTQADVVGLPVVCPEEAESVLVGAAILGACAAQHFSDLKTAIRSMGGRGRVLRPDAATRQFHDRKYSVFLRLLQDQLAYGEIMAQPDR